MKWYTATKRGKQHKVHCEDAALVAQVGKTRWLAAVVDGDSDGHESHFASTLFAKILRRMSNEFMYFEQAERDKKELKELQRIAIEQLLEELKAFKEILFLETEELMSTLLLLLVDTKTKEAELIVFGQGLMFIDGKTHCFRSDEKPDYLVYHLDDNFDEWFAQQEHKLSFDSFTNISIATDGFFSFCEKEDECACNNEFLQDFLFTNNDQEQDDDMMAKKLRQLEKEHGIYPTDDIALIRLAPAE